MSNNIEKLKSATVNLVGQLPSAVCDNMVILVKDVCEEAEKNQFYIDCLHSGGVDNWEWYENSMEDYWEKYDD